MDLRRRGDGSGGRRTIAPTSRDPVALDAALDSGACPLLVSRQRGLSDVSRSMGPRPRRGRVGRTRMEATGARGRRRLGLASGGVAAARAAVARGRTRQRPVRLDCLAHAGPGRPAGCPHSGVHPLGTPDPPAAPTLIERAPNAVRPAILV